MRRYVESSTLKEYWISGEIKLRSTCVRDMISGKKECPQGCAIDINPVNNNTSS